MKIILSVYTLLFALLIAAEYSKRLQPYHLVFKFLNSLGFVAAATWAAWISGNHTYYMMLLPGFLFCTGGDVFLGIKEKKHGKVWFMAGLVSFLTGHIAFLWAFHQIRPIGPGDFVFPAVMVIATYFLTRLENMDMQGATIPVLCYAFFVSMLMAKGISLSGAEGSGLRYTLLMSGTILFWFSDALILFIIFYRKKYKWSHFINLLTYYYGMFLMAVSIRF